MQLFVENCGSKYSPYYTMFIIKSEIKYFINNTNDHPVFLANENVSHSVIY